MPVQCTQQHTPGTMEVPTLSQETYKPGVSVSPFYRSESWWDRLPGKKAKLWSDTEQSLGKAHMLTFCICLKNTFVLSLVISLSSFLTQDSYFREWFFKASLKQELDLTRASLVAQTVKNLPAVQETQVQSLGQEDSLEKGVATHFGILAWRIPWTEEPGGLKSMRSQRVRHNWETNSFIRLNKFV